MKPLYNLTEKSAKPPEIVLDVILLSSEDRLNNNAGKFIVVISFEKFPDACLDATNVQVTPPSPTKLPSP